MALHEHVWGLSATGAWAIDRVLIGIPRFLAPPRANDGPLYRIFFAAINAYAMNPQQPKGPPP